MGKRKEIKFMCRDGRTFEGRQDGVLFWIRENQILRRRGLPCYYVAANDTKGKGRTVFTGDHEHFTLEGAKGLCQQIMAGEANLGERKARYAAEDAKRSVGPSQEATEQAKNFRGQTGGCRDLFREIAGVGGRNGRPKFNGPQYPAGLGEWGGLSA